MKFLGKVLMMMKTIVLKNVSTNIKVIIMMKHILNLEKFHIMNYIVTISLILDLLEIFIKQDIFIYLKINL